MTQSHRFELYINNIFLNRGLDIGLYYDKDRQYTGESRAGIEIKFDAKLQETENLFIEYNERLTRYGSYVNSGILKYDDIKHYLIGNFDEIFLLSKTELKGFYYFKNYRKVSSRVRTSKGYLLPKKDALIINKDIDEVVKEIGPNLYS